MSYSVYEYSFARRVLAEGLPGNDPYALLASVLPLLGDPSTFEVEHLWTIALDTKLKVIAVEETARGAIDGTYFTLAGILRLPVRLGCVHVAIAHNHPSGDPTPSPQDRALWTQLQDGARLLGITAVDSLILGGDRSYSHYKEGLL